MRMDEQNVKKSAFEEETESALQAWLYALDEESEHELQAFLDALANTQGADRLSLLDTLGDFTYREGEVYPEEALFVLPTLLRLLANATHPDEQWDLLAWLALYIQACQENSVASPRATLGIPTVKRLYQDLCEAVPLYTSYLSSTEPKLRSLAAFILGYYTSTAVDIIASLKELFAEEQDEIVQFAIVKALTLLHGYTADELHRLFASTRSFAIKHALALALVEVCGDGIKPIVEEIIVHSLLDDERLEKAYYALPYPSSPEYTTLDILPFLGQYKCVKLLLKMIEQWPSHPSPREYMLLTLTEYLLERAGFADENIQIRLKPSSHSTFELHYEVRWRDHDWQCALQELSEQQYHSLRQWLRKGQYVGKSWYAGPSSWPFTAHEAARQALCKALEIA